MTRRVWLSRKKMRNQITGFSQAIKNSQQGMSMLKTAEGAMGQQHEILGRIRELVVQSNNGTMNADNLATIQNEINELVKQIDSIAKNTKYNGQVMMDGSMASSTVAVDAGSSALGVIGVEANISGTTAAGTYDITFTEVGGAADDAGSVTISFTSGGETKTQTLSLTADSGDAFTGILDFDAFGIKLDLTNATASALHNTELNVLASGEDKSVVFQVGADKNQDLKVSISDTTAFGLALADGGGNVAIDVSDLSNFDANLDLVDNAITTVANARASMGSFINRFEANINNLTVTKENLQASESLIRDLDMADEMVQLTRNQVLSQASTAMLAQANQKPQAILQLMR